MKTQFFKRTAIALMVCGASATVSLSAMAEVTDEKFNDLKETVDALWGSDNKLLLQDGNIVISPAATKYNGVGGLYESLDTKIKNIYGDNVKINSNGTFSLKDDPDNTHAERQFNLATIIKDLDDTNDVLDEAKTKAEANEKKLSELDTKVANKVEKTDFNVLSTKVDGKAEKTDFDTLSSKVNRINTGLNNVNTDVETNTHAIAENKATLKAKAGKAYVDEKLEAKADKSEVTTALAEKASMDDVLSYHNATLNTLKDASDRISKNEDQIAAINERHDKVDAEKRAALEKSIEHNAEEITTLENEFAVLGAIHDTEEAQIQALADHRARQDVEIHNLDTRLNRLDKKLKRGLASQAALSGLFQPYTVGKFNATAAVGGYNSQQAVAVGAGYRFNEHVAGKAGVAFAGHGDVSYHAGVNFEW